MCVYIVDFIFEEKSRVWTTKKNLQPPQKKNSVYIWEKKEKKVIYDHIFNKTHKKKVMTWIIANTLLSRTEERKEKKYNI